MLLGFMLSIFVIRQLGPHDYGVYGLVLSVVTILPLFTRLGFDETIGKYVPQLSSSSQIGKAIFLFRRLLLGRAAASILALGVLYFVADLLGEVLDLPDFGSYWGIIALLFMAQEIGQSFISFSNARLQLQKVAVYHFLLQLLSLLLTFLFFAKYGIAVRYVFYALIAGRMAGLAWYLVCEKGVLLFPQEDPMPLKSPLRLGVNIWLLNMSQVGLGTEKDILLLGMLARDTAQVGYYKAGAGFVLLIHGFLFKYWTSLALPALSEANERQGSQGLQHAWRSYIKLMSLVGTPIFGFFLFFAAPIVHLLLTDAYGQSVQLLQVWSLITITTTMMGHGLSTMILYVLGKERLGLGVRLIAAVISIGLGLLIIPWLGALGAVIASGIVSIGVFVAETRLVAHYLGGIHYPFSFCGKIALAVFVASIARFTIKTSSIWLFMLSSGVFAILFFTMLRILKPLDATDRRVLKEINPHLSVVTEWF